jgi:hypothetical protein
MGPSYDVPHMLLTFGVAASTSDDSAGPTYHVTADYVPRGPTVLGGDPQYLDRYYGDAGVQASWHTAHQSGVPLSPPPEFELRLLASPVRLSVTGVRSSEVAEALVRNHAERFLGWIREAAPVPPRSRGSYNLRDDKLRQFFYRGQMRKQVQALGEELGSRVAAANTGPTAEAYVGGGS